MSHRFLTSIMSLWLVSCAGSAKPARETDWVPHSASSSGASKAPSEDVRKAAAPTTNQSGREAARDAKTVVSQVEEEWPPQDFSGVDVSAPVDSDTDGPHEVEVKGIEGTTSRYDVRTTLENRAEDFDRCHDRVGGGSGRIVFRIHILENGDVGGVKVRTLKVRNRKLVACYAEVVSSSHFTRPHGGYADVKWTTKVGRSPKRPDAFFKRRGRWDTPAGSVTPRAEADRRRGRRRHQQRNGA